MRARIKLGAASFSLALIPTTKQVKLIVLMCMQYNKIRIRHEMFK